MGLTARWLSPTELAIRTLPGGSDDHPDGDAPADVVLTSPSFAACTSVMAGDELLHAVLDARVHGAQVTGPSSAIGVVVGSWIHPWAPWTSPRVTFELLARTSTGSRLIHTVEVHHDAVEILGPHAPRRGAPALTVTADAALLLEWLAGDFCLGNVLALGGTVEGSLWHLSMLDAVMLWRRAEAEALEVRGREALARLLVNAQIVEFRDRLVGAIGRMEETCTWYDGT